MARHSRMHAARFTLVAVLLGALLAMTAGVVAVAASITASPGTAAASPVGNNTFAIAFTTTSLDLDVNCGAPTALCAVWVARNNAAKGTEVLFTNVTGSRAVIPITFINDGCFNLRLYDSAHATQLGAQMNVGHGFVCNGDGTGHDALDAFAGSPSVDSVGGSGVFPFSPSPRSGPVDWDSGFMGGVEDSQLWITQSQAAFSPIGGPAPGLAFTDCNAIPYPNSKEVLYAENVSGEKNDLALLGGGPYCFTLYQGSGHTTKIAGPAPYEFRPYLQYTEGTTNPTAGLDNAGGTIYFASGNGATNALVCVHGDSIPGSDILHQTPFVFNSEGWNPGGTVATFQTVGAGVNKYTLHIGVTGLDAGGNATAASCQTGTTPSGAAFFIDT
jgi:hypothetical protein